MKAIKKIALVSLLLVFGACSPNTQQDPLSDASDSVKNGVPPTYTNKPTEQAIPKEALQIDAPGLVNSRVGSDTEVIIQGRVLIPQVGFTLQIENLAQFPGATFNPATGVFKWLPKAEMMGPDYTTQFNLIVQLVTLPGLTNYPVSVEKKTIVFNITRNYTKPIISEVRSGTGNQYVVGATYSLGLIIEDQDAATGSDLKLVFQDCKSFAIGGLGSLASSVSFDGSKFMKDSTGKYVGNLDLNLGFGNYPYNKTNFCFTVTAISKYGVASDIYEFKNMTVKNPLTPARATSKSFDVKKGTIADYSFSVFDPTEVGALQTSNMPDMTAVGLPGSTLSCFRNPSMPSIMDCKLHIDATTLALGIRNLSFIVRNEFYPQDPVQSTIALTVNVKEIL